MKYSFYISLILISLTACDEKLGDSAAMCSTEVEVAMPADLPEGKMGEPTYTFKNVTTGATTYQRTPTAQHISGIYDIGYEAPYTADDGRHLMLRAFKQSCILTETANRVKIDANFLIDTNDLIISEIFFTGTQLPSGNSYNGDDYVKLYNNTDHVIYADGLTLFESKFSTTEKNAYTPDIMDRAMTVQALYTIPGRGKDHPVQPGGYMLLADNAIDHRIANPNSLDLSHADFEWYDVSSSPTNLDIDNPDVENLEKWYCYTRSYWMLHNRGFKAYGIARVPIGKETYLKDHYYTYEYEVVTAAGTFPMTGQAYSMPNEWIVDVVCCSVASDYAWNVCAAPLDCGWTYCGKISNDKSRFGKAVRRKVLYVTDDGRNVLKDTNNSSEDFEPEVKII